VAAHGRSAVMSARQTMTWGMQGQDGAGPPSWMARTRRALRLCVTLKLGGATLTMPGGSILTPARSLSAVGCWIVGPADLTPAIAP
jgi:hypothetical protein